MPTMNGNISPYSCKKKTGVNVDHHAVTLSLPPQHQVKQGLLPCVAMSNVNPTWLFSFRYELLYIPFIPTQGATSRVLEEEVGLRVMVTQLMLMECGARFRDT